MSDLDPWRPGDHRLGQISPDPGYGLELTLDEAEILLWHGVTPTDENIVGNTMKRSDNTARATVELLLSRLNRGIDQGWIDPLMASMVIRGFIAATESSRLDDYCFDTLAAMDTLYRVVRGASITEGKSRLVISVPAETVLTGKNRKLIRAEPGAHHRRQGFST